MSTEYYLLNNKPRVPQYGYPRRNGGQLTGCVILHSTESLADYIGPDSGAENVARYIVNRTNPGSYHRIMDSDSIVKMLPWDYEAWQDAKTNNWTVGISFATQAASWQNAVPEWRSATLLNGARAFNEFRQYMQRKSGITVPLRYITRTEVNARKPGISFHGATDPTRRSDPWINSPIRAKLESEFLAYCEELVGGNVVVPPPVPPVPTIPTGPTGNVAAQRAYKAGEVRRIQEILNVCGFKLRLDDDYGPRTSSAVKLYQANQIYWPGAVIDGDWGPKTEAHYQWVRRLQAALNGWKSVQRIGTLAIDGDYGSVTQNAVYATMRDNHGGAYRGRIDGIPGPMFCKMIEIPTHP